jgi:hypothetical protein
MSSRQPRPPPKPEVEAQKKNEYIPNFIAKKPFYVGDDVGDDYRQSPVLYLFLHPLYVFHLFSLSFLPLVALNPLPLPEVDLL